MKEKKQLLKTKENKLKPFSRAQRRRRRYLKQSVVVHLGVVRGAVKLEKWQEMELAGIISGNEIDELYLYKPLGYDPGQDSEEEINSG